MPKRLIVNADDLGLSPGVNRGVIEAHTRGIVTSTTVMINLPDAPAGLEGVKAQAAGLGVGLHLNLTYGRPVSPPNRVRSLVDEDGHFHPVGQWPVVFGQFDAEDMTRELCNQVHRFIALAGHPPDHLDSHHGVTSLHPVAMRALLDLAAEYGIPIRNPGVSLTPEEAAHAIHAYLPNAPASAVRAHYEQLMVVWREGPQPRHPDHIRSEFFGENATLGDLLVLLTNLDQGVTEIMCHPGYAEGLTEGYAAPREAELAALTHPSAKEVVVGEQIKLITFAAL